MPILVGDVGGTKARLALADETDGRPELQRRKTLASAEYGGLAEVVRAYLSTVREPVSRACLAVACPVVEDTCRFPNLGWEFDRFALAGEIGLERVRLVNDLDAVCHALPLLEPEELVELQPGVEREGRPEAVIAAGTGLGASFATRHAGRRLVHSSEAGHVDFSPPGPDAVALLEHLRGEYGHVSAERVLSGPGLAEIYRFLVDSGREAERSGTRRAMESGDPAPVVSRRGMDGTDPACEAALDLFVTLYGAEAGNLSLTVQALGGVYVGGGIAPGILPKLEEGGFVEAFRAKGRFAPMMREIPVRVIVADEAGLLGAALAGGAAGSG